jgi:hypothetical protein
MRYALVYGGISGSIVIAVLILGLSLDLPSHFHSEWFGYLVMLVALSLIFVGVKRYRDVECGGVIRFGGAFMLGLGIALVAGAIYVILWEIYVAASGVDYMAEYQARTLADMQAAGASAEDIAETRATMALWGERLHNPLWRIPMIFIEIFPVGLIVALVSAALLRNPRLLPARAV